MSWSVVVPTNRPPRFAEFVRAWSDLFTRHGVHLFVMQDLPERDPDVEAVLRDAPHAVTVLCWDDVALPTIPRHTDMIRSWAFYEAWRSDPGGFTLTLDDDVLPVTDVFSEYERTFERGAVVSEYLDVAALTTSGLQMRGFPARDRAPRTVAVQYGGWDGCLDLAATTQRDHPGRTDDSFAELVVPVPKGAATTGCMMNCAFRTAITPIMWQLPLVDGRYNRIGDIWSGLFIKRALDAGGQAMVINGRAKVLHERASDLTRSLSAEAASVELNDQMWDALPEVARTSVLDAYVEVTDGAAALLAKSDPPYADHFVQARDDWLGLFA
jgi:hypothetical protein